MANGTIWVKKAKCKGWRRSQKSLGSLKSPQTGKPRNAQAMSGQLQHHEFALGFSSGWVMLHLWYHRREEHTIQVLTVNKSIGSFQFQRKYSARSVEEPSLLGLSAERFRDYSGLCPTRAFLAASTPVSPRQRGELC